MTFCKKDLTTYSTPQTSIINANGDSYQVVGVGTVALSSSISLPNTLLVPSLSNKLMSVGQPTEDLNCVALMYSKFCLFQDILTKEIIGCGTKRGGLYYMEDFNSSKVHNVLQSRGTKEKLIWL
ncbi:hypothetical protein TanjilG_00563 [Lupinus angustifolius]|nr:hypothetical protein TanjilG_00563 [Lupinus angustifolius]